MLNSTSLKLLRTGPTSPRFPSSLKLRRTGLWTRKLLIFSLSCVCFANLFCMERLISRYLPKTSKWNSKPIEAHDNKIDSEKNGILSLPNEIKLEIIKFALQTTNVEELEMTLTGISQLNRIFRQLIYSDSIFLRNIWFQQLNWLEQNKMEFNNELRLKYVPITYKFEDKTLVSMINLLKKLRGFIMQRYGEEADYYTENDNDYEDSFLELVAKPGNFYLMKTILIRKLRNIEYKDKSGITPLIAAARVNNKIAVQLLLEAGAKIEFRDFFGNTALIWAALTGSKEVVELLLKRRASIACKNNEGYTPLMWAAANGHNEVVSLLLKNGADIETNSLNGLKAIDFARNHKKYETVLQQKENSVENNSVAKKDSCVIA